MGLKKLGAAILVVAALSAVLASSAFATASPTEVNWQKGESPYQTLLTEPMTVTAEAGGLATFAFSLNGAGSEVVAHATGVECLGCQITNEGTGGSGTGKLKLTGVTVEKPTGCTLPSTITSSALSFSARYKEGEAELVKFVPATGETLFYVEVSGCALENLVLLKGSLFGKLTNAPGVQASSQPMQFSPSINSAAGGSSGLKLTATAIFKSGGMFFGVAPGGVVLPEPTQTPAKWYAGTTKGGVTELTGSQAVTAEQSGGSTFATTVGAQEYSIHATGVECLECKISNSPTAASGTGRLKFTGVTVEKPAGCRISSTITTKSLTLAANWMQGATSLVRFTPSAGETTAFEALEVEGCSLETTLVPKGVLFGALSNGQGVQATSQTVVFNPTINSNASGHFYVGSKPATLTATDIFKAGGLFFGVK